MQSAKPPEQTTTGGAEQRNVSVKRLPAEPQSDGHQTTLRTGAHRLAAISGAMERGGKFRERVHLADGDALSLADLMAEAIAMNRDARAFEVVRGGRAIVCIEEIESYHCMDAARAAYLYARRSKND